MRSNSVFHSDQAYKRGVILGLTMAEAVLLVLFSLLLALAALFMHQEKRIEKVERDKQRIEEITKMHYRRYYEDELENNSELVG